MCFGPIAARIVITLHSGSLKGKVGAMIPDFPKGLISLWPEGRADDEASEVYRRSDSLRSEGGRGGRKIISFLISGALRRKMQALIREA